MKITTTQKVKKVPTIKEEYCKLVGIDKRTPLTEQNLNRHALRRACLRTGLLESDARKILFEDAGVDKAFAQTTPSENKVDADDQLNDIIETLDDALAANELAEDNKDKGQYQSVIIEGSKGVGKTSIVRQFCEARGLEMVKIDLSLMNVETLGGVVFRSDKEGHSQFVERLMSEELFLLLGRKDCVLFLDEYNRAPRYARRPLMDLVEFHSLPIVAGNEELFSHYGEVTDINHLWFPTLKLVVGAQNPNTQRYGVDPLDDAEQNRFWVVTALAIPENVREHLVPKFNKLADQASNPTKEVAYRGMASLADKLLSDSGFRFEKDDADDDAYGRARLYLTPRSLENALMGSLGKKDKFLKVYPKICGDRTLPMVETILADYEDIDDKANQALDADTDSELLNKALGSSANKIKNGLKQRYGVDIDNQ